MSAAVARIRGIEPGEPSDAELLAGVARGDLGPLGELFDRHHAGVRHFLVRVLRDQAEADDLVQETFLTASRAAGSYEATGSARSFLIGIAAQLVRRRRRSWRRLFQMLESFEVAPRAPARSPEDLASVSEESERLQAELGRLSEDHRLTFCMIEIGGMSGVEVARTLGIPPGTVGRRLHEARAELRAQLTRGAR